MTAADFTRLPEELQCDLLYADGVYVGKRTRYGRSCLLFQYEAFYVEIVYKSYRGKIHAVYCYTSTKCLDPYLPQVDVLELIR